MDESLLFEEFVQRSFAFEGNGFQWLTLYSPLSIYSSVNVLGKDGMKDLLFSWRTSRSWVFISRHRASRTDTRCFHQSLDLSDSSRRAWRVSSKSRSEEG